MAAPVLRLGAASTGVLSLPDATPAPGTLYAPRGVYLEDDLCVVADSGNHRVLIWHGAPTEDGQAGRRRARPARHGERRPARQQ